MAKQKGDSNFLNTIEELKKVEEEAERIKGEANLKAEEILKKSKEKAAEIARKTESESVERKNKLIETEKNKIETEVQVMLEEANAKAKKISKMRLKETEIAEIFNRFIASF